MLDFINANTYEDISDFLLVPGDGKHFTTEFLKKNGIIFAKTDYIDQLFYHLRFSARKYILITHHSDYPINYERFSKKPPCIKKWFSYNVTYDHPDLIEIPVGIYVHRGWTKNLYIKFDIDWFINNLEKFQQKKKITDTVYCNWAPTNVSRNKIIETLEKNNIKYYWETGLSFEDYCESMSNYKFVIAPQGNAEDTYTFRAYESMHMDSIPIVTKTRLAKEFTELPMIQLNNWDELTPELMESYLTKTFNKEKMYMTYWKDKIYKEFKKL